MLKKFAPCLALLITIVSYCTVVFISTVNLPFFDDITQILWMLNQFINPKTGSAFVSLVETPDKLHALFYPNAGHIPLGTRLFSLLQYYSSVVNFQISLWVANAGWILTMLVFMQWVMKNIKVPLLLILPVPFLMMSISHWEAMSMNLGGWQMYWGASLFPILVLIAVVSGSPFLSSILYFGALFESGGSLCLYPLALGFFLLQKQWRNFFIFAVLAGIQIIVFLYFNPISSNTNTTFSFSLTTIKIMLAFFGNIFSIGSYDLQPLAAFHISIGLAVLVSGFFCIFTVKNSYLPKLLIIYILILSAMAIYKRPDVWIVSRYSCFALLAVSSVYCLFLKYFQERNAVRATYIFSAVATCFTAVLWGVSLYYCIEPLKEDRKMRVLALQKYIDTGDASSLMWSNEWANRTFKEAKQLGLYDYEVGRNMTP